MRVIVLGSGVIGTTTAYYLASSGASVTVLDRQDGPALETSFANAGQVSPGYSTPWAAPGIPLKALKWLFEKHAPLAIRPDGSLYQWRWMAQMLSQCAQAPYALNKERMLRLAEYSRDCLRSLREQTGIEYEHRSLGTLQLFRHADQMTAARRDMAVLAQLGVPYELVLPERLGEVEPALAVRSGHLAGGLRLPNDETGDCFLFTNRLQQLAAALGVEFRYGTHIERLEIGGSGIRAVHAGGQRLEADAYVLALGSYSRAFALPVGLDLPVYPVKGYSITAPILDSAAAPVSTILDETYKIAVTRFDERIRVGGMAELAGFDLSLNPKRRETLTMVVNDLFPGACDTQTASFWTGLRPMTPDSTPIVGATPYDNLFLNTGHGTLGWTMSCGSGRLVADLVLGRQPDISAEGLGLARYRSARPVAGRNRGAQAS